MSFLRDMFCLERWQSWSIASDLKSDDAAMYPEVRILSSPFLNDCNEFFARPFDGAFYEKSRGLKIYIASFVSVFKAYEGRVY
jgi:hypothetical protein